MKKYSLLFLASFAVSFLIFSLALHFNVSNKSFTNKKNAIKYPSETEWLKRTFPYFTSDRDANQNAIEQAKQLKAATKQKFLSKHNLQAQWEFAGPINIGGRVSDIEFNPLDPNIVYAGAATGGVFKSTDMGETWFPIFDDQPILPVGDIAVDPVNPNIIFVGTGEPNGGHNNFPGGGVFKSTDAGNTWSAVGTNEGMQYTASIGRIIIDPVNTQKIFVCAVGSYFAPNSERGVYRSTDGGDTWHKSLFVSDSCGAIDITFIPSNTSIIFAAMWERVRRPNSAHLYGPESGIYKSTDGGDSWIKLSAPGLPNSSSQNIGRIGLAASPSQPGLVYALYNDGAYITGLYKTTDYGASWSATNIDIESSNFSWYFGQIRVHPTNPETIYAMDVSFGRSTNGGDSWDINYGYGGPAELHVDHHALALHPANPNFIINGNDGGINISTNGGITWSAHKYLPITQFYEIGIDLTNPARIFGGTQDNGTNGTFTGQTDNWENIWGGDGFYVLVDPINPNIIYAESQYGALAKLDYTNNPPDVYDATSGINFGEPTNWSTPVVMDPNNNQILYYGTDRIYRTTNGTASWEAISGDLTDAIPGTRLGTVTTIAVAPSNSSVIYAGTDDAHVWVSDNNGTKWRDLSLDNNLPYRWVTRVIVDPYDASIVYATFSGLKWRDPQPHVFRSTDMGVNWEDISNNLPDAPVNAFAVDYNNTNILYLGNDVGVFYSINAGQTWESLGEGMPIVVVNDMKIHPTGNYLLVGTHGRSMYKIDLSQVSGIDDGGNTNVVKGFKLEQNYPNPFNPTTVISCQLLVTSLLRFLMRWEEKLRHW
ncbi:MAG: hypothetical protein V1720_19975 [bacterium]